jgi:N-acetylated-alpha-linked acidic dipeptidase
VSHFASAAQRMHQVQALPGDNPARLNGALRETEAALLSASGLPNRPWYRHTIYAPGEYTGYAAVVIPGVNEAMDAKDAARVRQQLEVLAAALNRAAQRLDSAK